MGQRLSTAKLNRAESRSLSNPDLIESIKSSSLKHSRDEYVYDVVGGETNSNTTSMGSQQKAATPRRRAYSVDSTDDPWGLFKLL